MSFYVVTPGDVPDALPCLSARGHCRASYRTKPEKHYSPIARTLWALSLLAPLRRKAVDPVVGLGAGEGAERLADAVLEALDAALSPPLGG
jgi:hypothetical protein